ncbi:MAG: hypothetical protein QM808_17785 [Steroidobacteraceae bacterium]
MEWQNARMRKAIKNYRLREAIGTTKPSWEKVAEAVERCTLNVSSYPPGMVFDGEALRQFFVGTRNLSTDRWEHVKNFLLETKLLTEDDFRIEAREMRELFVVAESLANESPLATKRLSNISGNHAAQRFIGPIREDIEWEIRHEPEISAFIVHEKFVVSVIPPLQAAGDRSVGAVLARGYRRGYGFASTALNLLHIFVRGADDEDRITYVETEIDRKSASDFSLLRHGASLPVVSSSGGATLADSVIGFKTIEGV